MRKSSMAKKENLNEISNDNDELTQRQRTARKKKKRKKLIITICICVGAIIVIAAGVLFAQRKITSSFSSTEDAVSSAEVTSGSISESISGSGTLESTDVESITIPSSVEITDFYYEVGDSVSEGDLVASVNSSDLLSAMSSLQDELDTLDAEIENASADEVDSTITAGTSGRVKKIYAEEDEAVADVMYEYGSLILLSLDGYMAVEIETDSLETGDSVTVTTSDSTAYDGIVEEAADGTAVILVTDNGPEYADTVTVTDSSGNELGSGQLYIHQELAVTGYAGTVSSISVSENESVDAGDTLITLTDTETSVNYDTLLSQRESIEESLATLIAIYTEGGICAPCDGVIESLYESSSDDSSSMGTSSSSTITALSVASSTSMTVTVSVDESDILYISEGLEAQVTVSSVSDDAVSGTVTDIDTEASSSSGVTTYSATVTIDKTDDMLSGMSATVVIVIEGVDDALLIPVDALYQTSSTSYVYTEYDESTGELSGMVEVTTGLSNSSYVEITSGLEEGDTVYYASSSSDDTSSFDMSGFGDVSGGDSIGGDSSGTGSLPGGDTSGGSIGGDTSGGGMSGMPGAN